jgi:hypothetical protein
MAGLFERIIARQDLQNSYLTGGFQKMVDDFFEPLQPTRVHPSGPSRSCGRKRAL